MANKPCIGCTSNDTDPRHQDGLAAWHMDCHVLATGCDTCAAQLEACGTEPGGDVKGAELRDRLIALRDTTNDDQES